MWEQIRSNRIRSMVVVTAMGVILVITGVALGGLLGGDPLGPGGVLGGAVALGLWLIMWVVAVSKGDDVMLKIAGARQIEKKDHPQLFNVVEEMTIASRLPGMPRVFIVDDPSPNAFATGRDPKKAAVSVTTGLLRILDRAELQGVVAHEIGHIKNRDVALMTTAGIMLGAIVLLAEVGLRAMWFGAGRRRSRSSNDGGGQAVVMVVAIILMILAPILAQLIYFALSRRREYLADASGALFTRYPEGLACALEKLSGARVPLSDKSKVTAPMYIVKPLAANAAVRSAVGWFSTHPPAENRIKILRSMAGGAGLGAYEEAFRQVNEESIIGARTLQSADTVAVDRPASEKLEAPRARARKASDAFLAASGYDRKTCPGCQAILKIPPRYQAQAMMCPRCQTHLP